MVRCDSDADAFASPTADSGGSDGDGVLGWIRTQLDNVREALFTNQDRLSTIGAVAAIIASVLAVAETFGGD